MKITILSQSTISMMAVIALTACIKMADRNDPPQEATTATTSSVVAPGDVKLNDSLEVASLTGTAGDAAAGREAFANRKLGNCLACHANEDLSEQLFHGNVGPSLNGVGSRYPEGLLRSIVINAKGVFGEQSVMPGFYSLDVGSKVAEKFQGKTILSAEQVEDIVAYLTTLQ